MLTTLWILTFTGAADVPESHIKKHIYKFSWAVRFILHRLKSRPHIHIHITYNGWWFNSNLVNFTVNWVIHFVKWVYTWIFAWRIRNQSKCYICWRLHTTTTFISGSGCNIRDRSSLRRSMSYNVIVNEVNVQVFILYLLFYCTLDNRELHLQLDHLQYNS